MASGNHILNGIGMGGEVADFDGQDYVNTHYDLGYFFIDVPAAGTQLKVIWANGDEEEKVFPVAGLYPCLAKRIVNDAFNNITECSVMY